MGPAILVDGVLGPLFTGSHHLSFYGRIIHWKPLVPSPLQQSWCLTFIFFTVTYFLPLSHTKDCKNQKLVVHSHLTGKAFEAQMQITSSFKKVWARWTSSTGTEQLYSVQGDTFPSPAKSGTDMKRDTRVEHLRGFPSPLRARCPFIIIFAIARIGEIKRQLYQNAKSSRTDFRL